MSAAIKPAGDSPAMSLGELVALLVAMTAVVALAIDMMLPALDEIAADLGTAHANDRQYVITTYLLGFGLAQLIYGPLSDAYGRKPVILGALGLFLVATLACMFAQTFEALLLARLLQGSAAAACRVIATAIARDLTSGRRMAEVMSMVMTVFMAVPVLAPGLGQLILFYLPWQGVFGFLFLFALGLVLWLHFRMPETLHPEYRQKLGLGSSVRAFAEAMTTRLMLGYTLAGAAFFSGLYGFLGSSEQIFAEHFQLGDRFPLAFAGIAFGMGLTSYANSKLVMRWGQRRLSHGALIGFTVISVVHSAVLMSGVDNLAVFMVLLAAAMALLGLIGANFSAIAMEPVGHIAGTASAAYGFVTGVAASLIGALIGQLYDGTAIPLVTGQALMGALAIVIVLVTERGRLFENHEGEAAIADT
ncbi:multidrug effflux MFS transporter [uncultured Maricaulis sp.]|uniref:multidrug effflux MFS transporter n=1 Tax=uncultured Maricaulis sp. TaxID=174710 RepID=UPI0030D9A137|tara:strand:- start:56077 stop:57330 length:1254 start_codon:yes stop_codon:yes gene_type:complete